jgi:putative transposase
VEAGAAVNGLGRKHGFSDASFYKWRSRFGGMDVADVRRLRELKGESGKLKKLLAEAMLDMESLRSSREENGKPAGAARGGPGEHADVFARGEQ